MMTLNTPLADYLTLTTWEQHLWAQARHDWLSMRTTTAGAQRRMQYGGINYDGVFFGIGEQRGKPHYMVQASGEAADRVLSTLPVEAMNCTRIDLQLTVEKPPNYDARAIVDLLREADWTGRRRQVNLIESDDGYDTIYIGNRQSDRFTRIYVKPTGSDLDTVRFEVEYKGDHARTIFRHVVDDPQNMHGILLEELQSIPMRYFGVFNDFHDCLHGDAHKPPIKRVNSENSTLEWLSGPVTSSILRLHNAHDTHDRMLDLLRSWCRMCGIDTNIE